MSFFKDVNMLQKPVQTQLLRFANWLTDLVPAYSLVGNDALFSAAQFPWVKGLEANWHVIRQELEPLLAQMDALPNYQDISERQRDITNDNAWKTYFFYAHGFKAQKNCDRCPQTWALLQNIPGLQVAFFSILAPGKHIPEHCGKHKGVLRYHLALKVPEPRAQCRIRLNGQDLTWEEGKSLLFDDTYPHAVWNDTSGARVVLFVDFMRPLRWPLSWVNWAVCRGIGISPIIQDAKANHEAWEQRFETGQ